MSNNLNQGQSYSNYQNKYKSMIKPSNLEMISVGELNIVNNIDFKNFFDYKEGMTNGDTPVEKLNLAELEILQKKETDFNNKLRQYLSKYEKYLEVLASRQKSTNSNLRNKVMKTGNGGIYYINNAGVARWFSPAAWRNKDNTCSNPVGTMSNSDFNKLPRGPPMGIKEMCRSGGYNAMDSSSGTTAWIDTTGFKHVYSNFRERHKSCPASTEKISSIAFNAIPSGRAWTSNNSCDIVNLDSPLYSELRNLNSQLLNIVTSMKSDIVKFAGKNKTLDAQIERQKTILMGKYKDLQKYQKKVDKMKEANKTLLAESNEQLLDVSSIQMHHLIWAILGGTFIYAAVAHMNSD